MSVPNGNQNPIAFSLLRAALLCTLFCGGLASTSPANGQAHRPWARIAQRDSWTPETGWKPGPAGWDSASQLSECGEGRLFLSHGDSLFLSRDQGRTWKVIAYLKAGFNYGRRVPFATDRSGIVMWGNRISQDFGDTWRSPNDLRMEFYAYSIDNNRAWAGGSSDGISLSEDSGRTWKNVHIGRTFGRMEDFASTWIGGGWYFAAPEADQVQVSRDGILWTDLASRVGRVSGSGDSLRKDLIASMLLTEHMAYDENTWALEKTDLPGKVVLTELRTGFTSGFTGNDSISLVRHEATGGPDSAITCLGIFSPGGGPNSILWLGTWGQGVFMSHDRGESWHAWNTGLGDLHVQSLLVPDRGWNDSVFVLTRDGLYRLGAAPTGLAPAARRADGNTGHGRIFRSGSVLETASGNRVRADGRRPAMTRNQP
ncbi:MAG: hypothetical protein ABIW76_08320 [Fibrobacteria bacterium]